MYDMNLRKKMYNIFEIEINDLLMDLYINFKYNVYFKEWILFFNLNLEV